MKDHCTFASSMRWSKCPTSKRVTINLLELQSLIADTLLCSRAHKARSIYALKSPNQGCSICLYCLSLYKAKGHQTHTTLVDPCLIVSSHITLSTMHLKEFPTSKSASLAPSPSNIRQREPIEDCESSGAMGTIDLRFDRIFCI